MKNYIIIILKGIGMGAANVIPGVSGGTIALITGIFERLINAIKSFDLNALKFLFTLKLIAFAKHTDLKFLTAVFLGVFIAILSLAKLFEFLFDNYPVDIWAYFFGLVLASVYFVGKTISRWNHLVIGTFIIGTTIAVLISVLNPAKENQEFIYLLICGIAAVCSMILPGLSGSFILFIMGNYRLVVIDAINELNVNILFPVILGAVFGLIAFSHFLSWVFKNYRDETIAILTGFILGSVSILWPWQEKVFLLDHSGTKILLNDKFIVIKYQRVLPENIDINFWIAIGFIILGIASIWLLEKNQQTKLSK